MAPRWSEDGAQGALTDQCGKSVGKVLHEQVGNSQTVAKVEQPSKRTPATASDPLKIIVPDDFPSTAEEGTRLRNGWLCGQLLGEGQQGAVWLLKDAKGRSARRVFKQLKMESGSVGAVTGLEREWVIGQQLNMLCEPDGFLPGFMQTGSAVVDAAGRFRGLILEQLCGRGRGCAPRSADAYAPNTESQRASAAVMGVDKRLSDPLFADIDYVAEMLRQTLTALGKAELALGFQHGDLRVENVMEHYVEAEEQEDGGAPQPRESRAGDAKEQRGGGAEGMRQRGSPAGGNGGGGGGGGVDRAVVSADASRLSRRGPAMPSGYWERVDLQGLHFKIIDYGHAKVSRDSAREGDPKRRSAWLHRLLPRVPLMAWQEKLYSWIFRDRGDVWRLARSTGANLDGRTWLVQDRARVEHLAKFIRKTTGIRPRTYFADSPGEVQRSKGPLGRLVAVGGRLFFVRWTRTMVQAYIFPGRPTMRAPEALRMLDAMPPPASA